MNIAAAAKADAPAQVSVVQDARGLRAFMEPECAAAVWQREIPADVLHWLADLDPETLPRVRTVLPANSVKDAIKHICDFVSLPMSVQRDWLEADVIQLADQFANLMNAKYLRMRMDVVTTNACRRFHIDAITARLVCTYRGTGTQYGIANNDGDPTTVFTVPTGAPILLRGTKWPATPDAGLLHRSPPIEGTGETRLVLVLDPVFDPEEDG